MIILRIKLSTISYVDVDKALQILLDSCEVKPSLESVMTVDSYKRTLGQNIRSPTNVPSIDRSHMDGYAVRSADLRNASTSSPVKLKIKSILKLIDTSSPALKRGESIKVPTGGLVPNGSDAVVPKENARISVGHVEFFSPVTQGKAVVKKGCDIKFDDIVFRKGLILKTQDIALLRFLGFEKVKVYRRPVVGLLSVGTELTDKHDDVKFGKVFRSHEIMIETLVKEAGAIPKDFGIVPDDLLKIKKKIASALKETSVILTIGGSSVGDADLVSRAVDSLGAPGMIEHGLRLQPARVAGFGIINGKPIILLPGLIQSAVNAYIFLAYPLIRKLIGLVPDRRSWSVSATLSERIYFKSFREFKHVTWVKLWHDKEALRAKPILGNSQMMGILMKSDGYVLSDEGLEYLEKGTRVEVNRILGLVGL